jgi:sporulation protein YlmC with PRC-barrel domain
MMEITMKKVVILAAVLAVAPLSSYCLAAAGEERNNETFAHESGEDVGGKADPTGLGNVLDRLSQSQLRDQLASAAERVEDACAEDIEDLCGTVTPGEGRIALCVQANSDQLSRRCRFTLFRVSRQLRQSVSGFADECLNGIRTQCANAQKIGECAEQKSASISPACHTIVAALRQAGQKLANLTGMQVYSSDDKDLGRVVDVTRSPDGKIQTVRIQVGRALGLGDKVVSIDTNQLQQLANEIRLRLNSDQVRGLPEAGK